jgi:hypothetical protein
LLIKEGEAKIFSAIGVFVNLQWFASRLGDYSTNSQKAKGASAPQPLRKLQSDTKFSTSFQQKQFDLVP